MFPSSWLNCQLNSGVSLGVELPTLLATALVCPKGPSSEAYWGPNYACSGGGVPYYFYPCPLQSMCISAYHKCQWTGQSYASLQG